MEQTVNPLLKTTFQFALSVMAYCELLSEQKKYVIAKQLLKSGTSIGANCREAQNAESRADFIHKLKIALKETEETEYWLQLCEASENYPATSHLISKNLEIKRILTKIVFTARQNGMKKE